MGHPYTHGIWTVTPGHEDDFIAAWSEFAEWTKDEIAGSSWAALLRDRELPNRFISIGPWESLDAIEAWRAEPGWSARVQALREHLDSFEPSTLDPVRELE